MVDVNGVTTVTMGANAPFRQNSATTNSTASTGVLVNLTSFDAPAFVWDLFHPHTGNTWNLTSGGNAFQEFIVAYSNSFNQTYVSLNQASWSLSIIGTNDSSVWDNGDGTGSSSITGDTALGAVGTFLVQVLGLSFSANHVMVVTP